MGLLACCIGWLIFDVIISVGALPISAKSNFKDVSEEPQESVFLKTLNGLGQQNKTDEKKVKIPQYMQDLFASVTDNKTGRRQTDISLPGNIVRSFYSEGYLQREPAVVKTLDEDRCLLSVNDKVIDISSPTSRQIYGDLVDSKYRAPSAQQYFRSKFGRNEIELSQI